MYDDGCMIIVTEHILLDFYLWKMDLRIVISFNPFPHIDALWRLCSRRLFENMVTKEEIAQKKQFPSPFDTIFSTFTHYPFSYRDFQIIDKICSKSSAAELLYEGKS